MSRKKCKPDRNVKQSKPLRFLLAIATAAGASVAIAMAVSAYSSYFNPQDNRIIAVSGLLFPMLLGAHMLMTMVWLA